MNKVLRIRVVSALAMMIAATCMHGAELRLNRYFSDNMVLQREKPVVIKGFAGAGSNISVTFAGQTVKATADKDGAWAVTLVPMKADSKGQTLSVSDGSANVSLANVVVGDVLFFGRQSSIDVSLGKDEAGKKAARDYRANDKGRMMRIKTQPVKAPLADLNEKAVTPWAQITGENALKMNAAAFYLVQDISGKVDAPLGIVDIDMGPHFGVSWLSETALDESVESYGGKDLVWFRENMPKDVEKWERDAAAGKKQIGLSPLELPYYPSACYNAVLSPLRGIAPKGILLQLGNDYPLVTYAALQAAGKITDREALAMAWAQGYLVLKHANRMTPYTLPLVPDDLRRVFGEKSLPIGWIMPPNSDFFDYAIHNREIRELQRRTAAKKENIGLIMPGARHVLLSGQPADEKLLAERCRSWLLGTFYDKAVKSSGPVFDHIENKPGGQVTVYFKDGTADGLRADNNALKKFEVAGADGKYMPCEASIDGSRVKLTCDAVYQAVWVRYNWSDKPDQGLVNSSGLPAVPFNSDEKWIYDWWPPSPPVELPVEYRTTANKWPKRDIAIINGANQLAGGDSQPNPNDLGPTGIQAVPFGPNLYVHGTMPGTPADGKIFRGDYIFGVNGKDFGLNDDDKYRQFSAAITHAESRAGGGKMVLNVRRRGQDTEIDLKLDVLGSYSSTTPYYCPKTDKIVERAEEWLEVRARPKSGMPGNVGGVFGTDILFLMASGKPEYQGLVRRSIYEKLSTPLKKPDPGQSAVPWHLGYSSILAGEYYLLTGDTNALAYLENQVGWAAVTQLKPQSEPGPWEAAYTEQQVGGWRSRYAPNRPMVSEGYGLMPAAGMPCVMGMLLAKESGTKFDEVALARGLKHFYYRRAEYGNVVYWYHPLWLDKPPSIRPEAEANGLLQSDNGKLGTAASLFNMAGYPTAVDVCSRICVYSYNRTRSGHGGMFFNNFWTPVGAHIAGEESFKHFMKGQTWWRELYRRSDGSFNQVGRGGIGVGYAIHYVAPKKRLRMLDAPRSAFGVNPPECLKPALEAHRKRDYALAENLALKAMNEAVISEADMPVVKHFLDSIQVLRKSVEHDLVYASDLIKQGKYYYASLELPQLKGVVAPENPVLKTIAAALESPEGAAKIKSSMQEAQAAGQPEPVEEVQDENEVSASASEEKIAEPKVKPEPEKKRNWVCLVSESVKAVKKEPVVKPAQWRMKVLEAPSQAPEKWMVPEFDDSAWQETTLPIAWRVSHTALFRCKFTIDDKKSIDALRLRAHPFHQQNIEIYINGELVAKIDNVTGDVDQVLTGYALKVARNGENTFAIMTQHCKRWGKVKGGSAGEGGVSFMLDAGRDADK